MLIHLEKEILIAVRESSSKELTFTQKFDNGRRFFPIWFRFNHNYKQLDIAVYIITLFRFPQYCPQSPHHFVKHSQCTRAIRKNKVLLNAKSKVTKKAFSPREAKMAMSRDGIIFQILDFLQKINLYSYDF